MTYEQWSRLIFCQELSEAVLKSDNLRLPSNPEKTAKDLEIRVNALRDREKGQRHEKP